MTTIPPNVGPRFARLGANPTLEMIEYIRSALIAAGEPLSRNQLLQILAAWGHMTTRRSLNAALSFFAEDGIVSEGRKGVVWVPAASEELLRQVDATRRSSALRHRAEFARG